MLRGRIDIIIYFITGVVGLTRALPESRIGFVARMPGHTRSPLVSLVESIIESGLFTNIACLARVLPGGSGGSIIRIARWPRALPGSPIGIVPITRIIRPGYGRGWALTIGAGFFIPAFTRACRARALPGACRGSIVRITRRARALPEPCFTFVAVFSRWLLPWFLRCVVFSIHESTCSLSG